MSLDMKTAVLIKQCFLTQLASEKFCAIIYAE